MSDAGGDRGPGAPAGSPEPLLHLVGRGEWEAAVAAGVPYRPDGFDELGFVHLSAPGQVLIPANRLLSHRDDVVVLVVDPRRLTAEVRWEEGVPPEPGRTFPHLYGPLDLGAVVAVVDLPRGPGGDYELPALPALPTRG